MAKASRQYGRNHNSAMQKIMKCFQRLDKKHITKDSTTNPQTKYLHKQPITKTKEITNKSTPIIYLEQPLPKGN